VADVFPGFDRCMEMMREHDALTQEDGFHLLLPHAHEYVPQLIAAFEVEKDRGDSGLGFWFLELLAEAKSPEAFPLFAACLRSDHALIRSGAIYGLHKLDTKDARRLLWKRARTPLRRRRTRSSSAKTWTMLSADQELRLTVFGAPWGLTRQTLYAVPRAAP